MAAPAPAPVSYFVDPSGEVVELPAEQAASAHEFGYAPASPEQAEDFLRRDALAKQYGTDGQALVAGVEAAGRALTFGGSTVFERALGVDPEGIAAREELNPTAAGVGTAIGVAAPLLLTGGAAAPAELAVEGATGARAALAAGARLSAPSLASRAGVAATEALGRGLPAAEGVAGQLARKAAAAGLGSAVEGAAYGVGEVVHEAALGDPNLTAQSALATIGLSAALGGATGAGFGVAGDVLTHLKGKADSSEVAGKLADWLGEFAGERNLKAAGAIQSDITRMEKQIGKERLNELAQEMGDLGLVTPFSTPAKVAERAQALRAKAGQEIGAVVREADLNATPEQLPKIADVLGRAKVDVLDPLRQNPLQQEAANRLAGVIEGFDLRFGAGMTFRDLHVMRQQLDEAIYGLRRTADPFANAYSEALHDLRGIVSKELEDGIERVGISGSRWKVARREYEVASRALEAAEKGMRRNVGNNLVSLTELMGGLGGGVAGGPAVGMAMGAGTALARRHASSVLGSLAGKARDFLRGGATRLGGELGGEGGALVASEAASTASDVAGAARRSGGVAETRVITPQRPTGEPAHYELVEADDLIPSHNPHSFAPRREYPKGVQEREYHLQTEEQRKVVLGSQNLNPSLVLADTPSAVDGPPLVTSGDRRLVLGGNGRTMMIQRAFKDPKKLEAYRQALLEKAGAFGIPLERVQAMRQPVLVRVMDGVPSSATARDLTSAVRRYNEGLTQALSPRARAVAEAKALGPTTVHSIGELFVDAGDKSLRDLLREKPADFVAILQRDGIVNPQNRSAWVSGLDLTDEAKDRIEGMFLGRVVGTGERLAAASPATLRKVERMAPHLVRVQGVNPALDETTTVQAALDLMSDAARRGMTVEQLMSQGVLLGEKPAADAATLGMVRLLETEGQLDLGARFAKWARDAAVDPRQGMLFGAPPTLKSTRRTLFHGQGISDEALAERAVVPQAVEAPAPAAVAPPPPPPAPETVAALSTMERAGQQATRRIDSLASTLVRAGVKAENVGRAEVLAGVARSFGHDDERAATTFTKRAEQLRRLSQNPEALVDTLAAATDDLHDHAPTVAQALQATSARGVAFLASKLPQPPERGPLAPKWQPSRAEIARFERYAHAVDNPIGVLKQASAGTLTPESVEAVRAVYPELYDRMRESIVEQIARHPEVPYRSRVMLSMLLGQDVDGSIAGAAANQRALGAPNAAPSQQAPGVAPGGARPLPSAGKVTLSNRFLTAQQRSAERD